MFSRIASALLLFALLAQPAGAQLTAIQSERLTGLLEVASCAADPFTPVCLEGRTRSVLLIIRYNVSKSNLTKVAETVLAVCCPVAPLHILLT